MPQVKVAARIIALVQKAFQTLKGARYTRAKHAAQSSPYRHLLKPKAGGMAVALATMGEGFHALPT